MRNPNILFHFRSSNISLGIDFLEVEVSFDSQETKRSLKLGKRWFKNVQRISYLRS